MVVWSKPAWLFASIDLDHWNRGCGRKGALFPLCFSLLVFSLSTLLVVVSPSSFLTLASWDLSEPSSPVAQQHLSGRRILWLEPALGHFCQMLHCVPSSSRKLRTQRQLIAPVPRNHRHHLSGQNPDSFRSGMCESKNIQCSPTEKGGYNSKSLNTKRNKTISHRIDKAYQFLVQKSWLAESYQSHSGLRWCQIQVDPQQSARGKFLHAAWGVWKILWPELSKCLNCFKHQQNWKINIHGCAMMSMYNPPCTKQVREFSSRPMPSCINLPEIIPDRCCATLDRLHGIVHMSCQPHINRSTTSPFNDTMDFHVFVEGSKNDLKMFHPSCVTACCVCPSWSWESWSLDWNEKGDNL